MQTTNQILRNAALALVLIASAQAQAQVSDTNFCQADYRNTVFDGTPVPPYAQPSSIAVFSGHVGGSTNDALLCPNLVTPNDGQGYYLTRSVIGQPIGGQPATIVGNDFDFGEPIIPDIALDVDYAREPGKIDPAYRAAFISGTNRVFGTSPGFVQIHWMRNDGTTNSPVTYYVKWTPKDQPAMGLYHTHYPSNSLQQPKDTRAADVDVSAIPTILAHWNPAVPAQVSSQLVNETNSLFLARVGNQLRAKVSTGLILLEYRDGTNGLMGLQVVDLRYDSLPDTSANRVDIGFMLAPFRIHAQPAAPYVSRGKDEGFIYQHDIQGSLQYGGLWAIKRTANEIDMEVYWRGTSVAGVVWPYELHRYTANWPGIEERGKYQRYVRGSTTNVGPDVPIALDLNPTVMPFREPESHVESGPVNPFSTSGAGWSLLQFRPGNSVSFQVVRSVLHSDSELNLAPVDWTIGNEITENSHQGQRSGYIHVLETKAPKEDRYQWEIYHNSTNQIDRPTGFEWITNRIFAVNEGALEVWWSNVNTNGNVQWPSQVKRYNNVWPGNPSQIVIASQLGSGPLPSADARPYFQNDPSKPGYNPNDEHALLLPQHGLAEQHMELFPTSINMLEGGWASAVVTFPSLTGATTNGGADDKITLTVSGSRDGSSDLGASFELGTNVTEKSILPASWTIPVTVYFQLTTNASPLGSAGVSNLFTIRASGAFYDQQTVTVRAVPTNAPDLLVEAAALQLAEGSTRSFRVRPTLPPATNVQVAITRVSGNAPGLSVQPASLTFTPENWETPQPVTISSAEGSSLGTYSARFSFAASGGLSAVKTVDVTLLGAGMSGLAVYALRDDLGDPMGSSSLLYSEPHVLITYTDTDSLRKLKVYRVVEGDFTYPGTAGRMLQPPYPLGIYQGWEGPSYATNSPAAWEDRKQSWWARSGPDDEGPTPVPIVMKFFYPQNTNFFFRPGTRPVGTNWVPWLDHRFAQPTPGIPVDVVYQIVWPTDVPKLLMGESLVKAKFGLPAIKGQASVDVIYEETEKQGLGAGSCVKLIDPIYTHSAPLEELPGDTQGKTVTTLSSLGEIPPGSFFFTPLPPHLRSRIWWEPNGGSDGKGVLKFKGQFVQEFGTEEPVGYLLLNVLTDRDTNHLGSVSQNPKFWEAVDLLRHSNQADQVRVVPTNTIQHAWESFAITAGLARKDGYVTLAFNNVIAPSEGFGADRGTPVSVEIIRVTCPSYRGETKVVYPQDPFDERVNLRHSGDFAGQADGYEFQWQTHPVVPGQGRPAPESPLWRGEGLPQGFGIADITVGGSGAQTLSDWWYRCQWRTTNTASPCGTNFTVWTGPTLVEGWIKRVLGRINLFEQKNIDYTEHSVDTVANVLSQAGTRWIGSVPLNTDALDDMGLIEIYETVLKRGIGLSIEGNPPLPNDPGVSRALLMAASQLGNLYMLLGNEAYADAADPTIGFVTTGQFGVEATSKHSFMGQVDSLLEEELTLLRGLGDTNKWEFRQHPYYNRLRPNTDPRFPEAKTVYSLNYSIADVNHDGTPNEIDAQKIFSQGHGDAWGHYLMAIKEYYRLLRNSNFTWLVTDEQVNLGGGGGTVRMNYQYERRFAAIAAAKARTGAEIVNLTYRSKYVENPDGQWQGYLDADPNRAWGLAEWASRAGEGAYYDWVVGNALLPPNVTITGTNELKVDRTTVTELREVAAAYTAIQEELDKADAGLNPLGLSKNVIPFDIDPAQVDAGKTHFEQIYDRAVKAMNNAIGVFNRAQTSRQKLREQADDVQKFRDDVYQRENDFTNRLIEVFGYPYPDDPAFGGNPNVPDLYHFMYSDYSEITGEVTPPYVSFTVQLGDFVVSPQGELSQVFTPVVYHTAANGFGFVKPPHWTRSRRAPGDIQMSHSELLQAVGRFKRALKEYENLLAQIEDQANLLQAQYNVNAEEIVVLYSGLGTQESLNSAIKRSRSRQITYRNLAQKATLVANAIAEGSPGVFGVIAGMAGGVIGDFTSPIRSAVRLAGAITTEVLNQNADRESLAELDHQQAKESASARQNITLTVLRQELAILQQVAQIEQLVRQEALLRLEIYNQQEAMQQAAGRYASTLAKGQRLLEERTRFRQLTASQVQQYRYKDMAFRIFRDEAIQQYRAQFDLAARYVNMAAAAYDYETNLRDTETRWKPGEAILTDIVRARSIGVVDTAGNPQPGPGPGKLGDGGLAAAMYDLNHNWSEAANPLKSQLGFNNASRETLTFSLRSGLFRALTNDIGDESWRAWLASCVVSDVAEIPEFVRYCKPPNEFGQNGQKEPGFVIPFTSAIKYRHNFFGWPETGGGGNFSSSYFATKIKSIAVKFIGYDAANLNTSPHIYLVPVGNDVMLAPITQGLSVAPTREWRILDQFLPAPLPISNPLSIFPQPAWIPIAEMNSQDSFLSIRRYAQMRAYHDGGLNGTPTNAELEAYRRLIGRSVWNTRWLLIILGGDLLGSNPDRGIERFINGYYGDGEGVTDILLDYSTYSYPGN